MRKISFGGTRGIVSDRMVTESEGGAQHRERPLGRGRRSIPQKLRNEAVMKPFRRALTYSSPWQWRSIKTEALP